VNQLAHRWANREGERGKKNSKEEGSRARSHIVTLRKSAEKLQQHKNTKKKNTKVTATGKNPQPRNTRHTNQAKSIRKRLKLPTKVDIAGQSFPPKDPI